MSDTELRECHKCFQYKPLDQFYSRMQPYNTKQGRRYILSVERRCKACKNKRNVELARGRREESRKAARNAV